MRRAALLAAVVVAVFVGSVAPAIAAGGGPNPVSPCIGGTVTVSTTNGNFLTCDAAGNLRVNTTPLQMQSVISALIIAAQNTTLVTHIGTTQIYPYGAFAQAQNTESGAFAQWVYGTGVNCGTNTVLLTQFGSSLPTSSLQYGGYSITSGGNSIFPPLPGPVPLVAVPAGNDFCVITSGTTIAARFVTQYVQQ
jgi:hypothetical protein